MKDEIRKQIIDALQKEVDLMGKERQITQEIIKESELKIENLNKAISAFNRTIGNLMIKEAFNG